MKKSNGCLDVYLKVNLPAIHIIVVVWFWCMNLSLFAQPIDSLFQQAKRLEVLRYENIFSEQRDSIFGLFDSTMFQLLTHPDFCDVKSNGLLGSMKEPIDSLQGVDLAYGFMNNLICAESSDERIRLFSWDELSGGSGHSYVNYIQINGDDGRCVVMPFDTTMDNLEVGYYKIDKWLLDERSIYIFVGFGTYGGGLQHWRIRFFEFNGDQIHEIFEYYPDGYQWSIQCNRSQTPGILLDSSDNSISYKQFLTSLEMDGFYGEEYETVRIVIGH